MDWTMSNLAGATGIKSPTLLQSMIAQALESDNRTKLTIDEKGGMQMKVASDEEIAEKVTPKEGAKESKEEPRAVPQSAMAEFLAPYAGPSASELAGLTPEQVMAIVNAQRAAEGVARQTMSEISEIPLQQAQLDLIKERIRAAQAPPEQWENVTDEHGRWFKRNTATNEVRQVAGPPPEKPLTFDERMTLKKTAADIPRGDYWKSPETGEIKWIEAGKVPPPKWERVPASQIREVRPTVYERKLPTYAYDMLVSYIKDKEGKLLKKPDIAGIASLNEELKGEGKEVVEVEIEPLEKKWAFDLPGQTIHVIVDVGATSVTRSQVEDMLVSVYGLSPEDAKKVKVK